MKRELYKIMSFRKGSSFIMGIALTFLTTGSFAQTSPGGVSTGLRLWLKADKGVVTTGPVVNSWDDQSGGSRNLLATSGTYAPVLSNASPAYNFNPFVTFSKDFLRHTGNILNAGSGASVFSVANQSTGSGYNTLWDFYANDPTLNTLNGKWLLYHGGASFHSVPVINGKTAIASAHWLHNLAPSTLIEIDGKAEAANRVVNTNGNNYYLGAGSAAAVEEWHGSIAENIVYDNQLTGNGLIRVNSYLALKYGVTLDNEPANAAVNYDYKSSAGATIWDGVGNADYHNDITGIGRDDASELLQLKSKSVNNSSVVTIETAAIAADQQFLIVGDNAGKASLATPYTPNNILPAPTTAFFHYGRIWKVQSTGTIGGTTVTLSSGGATHILIHNSADFNTGTPTEIALVDGAATIALTDGQFFTFAGPATGPGGVVENLAVWLKADAGTSTETDGSQLENWLDQSGNNRTHTQATVANQPEFAGAGSSYQMNYNPAIRFKKGAPYKYLRTTNYINSTDAFHVISVSRINGPGTTAWQTLYSFQADYTHPHWFSEQPGAFISGAQKNNASYTLKYALSSVLMPKTGSQRAIWNGTPQSFANTAYTITNPVSPDFTLGADRNITDPFEGDIQEVIIYADPAGGDMSADHLQRIQSYLAIKYGISLDPLGQPNYYSAGGQIVWDGLINTGYQSNIFGLGRDDNASLNQKQAFSYGDSSISVYLGTLEGLNSTNSSVIAQNQSFLILGDNNLEGFDQSNTFPSGQTFANGNSNSIINALTKRIWKAQNTTQTSWTVSINTNNFKNAKYVLVSNAPDFLAANTRIYPVSNAVAQNVEINDGDYVAMGMFVVAPGGVADDLAFWVKSDNATQGSAWPDNSLYNNQIEVVGNPTLGAANAAHNFYPYYTGYSSANYFRDQNTSLTLDNTFGIPSRSPYSMFTSVRPTTNAGTGRIVGIDNDDLYAAEPGFSLSSGNPHFYKFWEGTGSNDHSSKVVAQQSTVLSYIADQTANAGNGTMTISLDGSSQVFNRAGGNYFHVIGKYLTLGYGIFDAAGAFPGDIMEVIWYKKTLNAAEALKVETYLALKNGVTMGNPSTPISYVNTASDIIWTSSAAGGTFQNNIAGIGRDDAEALNQKQSNSVLTAPATGQITIGLGSIEASNADNINTFANDLSYLVWGDNGVLDATTSQVLDYGTNIEINHLNRVWRVENTGVDTLVKISIPQTLAPGILTTCEEFKLITSTSGIINGASITSVHSVAPEGANFVLYYTFPAGESYFTLARVNPAESGIVNLPNQSTIAVSFAECLDLPWKPFYEDALKERKMISFADFSDMNFNDISVSIEPSGTSFASTTRETVVMPRITTITDASSGTYVGGKVRIYYSKEEMQGATIPDANTASWFKYSGSADDVIADVNADGVLDNAPAIAIIPNAYGVEDGVDFVEFHNVQSFSSFIFISSTLQENQVLPVGYSDFSGFKTGNSIRLNWITAFEHNNTGFNIERSTDGKYWQHLGTVSSKATTGTSNAPLQYSFTDNSPLNGNNHYRLKQIDADGKFDYSPILNFIFETATRIRITPNPPVNGITTISGLKAGDKIQVLSQSGQVILSTATSNVTYSLNLSAYPAGMYHLIVTNGSERLFAKILKVQ